MTFEINNLPHIKNDKLKRIAMTIACFIILINSIFPLRLLESTGLDSVIAFLMCFVCIAFSFNGQIKATKKRSVMILLLLALGFIEAISGVSFGVLGYISIGAFYIVVPTLLILSINSRTQLEDLMKAISIASVLAFMCLFVVSMVFMPLSSGQYGSFTGNPNSLSAYAVMGLCGAVYLAKKSQSGLRWLFFVVQGFGMGFVIFSRSRTALLTVIAVIAISVSNMLINKKNLKLKLWPALLAIAVVIVSVYISYLSVTVINQSIGLYDNEQLKKDLENHFNIYLTEYDEKASGKLTFDDVLKAGADRSLKGIADENSFSSGRTLIWKTFIDAVEITGHKDGTMTVGGIEGYNAHNAYIQTAYSFGGIAGVIYVFITIYAGWFLLKSFINAIRNRELNDELAFGYMIFSGYLIYNLLAAAVAPFSYFFVQAFSFVVLPCAADESFLIAGNDQ